MADKATLYIDYEGGTIRGPQEIIGRLFATPKTKTWLGPPEATHGRQRSRTAAPYCRAAA